MGRRKIELRDDSLVGARRKVRQQDLQRGHTARAHEEKRQRDGDLCHHERGTKALVAHAAVANIPHTRRDGAPRREPCRREAGDRNDGDHETERENERRHVNRHRYLDEPRRPGEKGRRPLPPDEAGQRRQQDRFDAEHPYQTVGRRAERDPHAELTASIGRPRQLQVDHVAAGDEEHADRHEQKHAEHERDLHGRSLHLRPARNEINMRGSRFSPPPLSTSGPESRAPPARVSGLCPGRARAATDSHGAESAARADRNTA